MKFNLNKLKKWWENFNNPPYLTPHLKEPECCSTCKSWLLYKELYFHTPSLDRVTVGVCGKIFEGLGVVVAHTGDMPGIMTYSNFKCKFYDFQKVEERKRVGNRRLLSMAVCVFQHGEELL